MVVRFSEPAHASEQHGQVDRPRPAWLPEPFETPEQLAEAYRRMSRGAMRGGADAAFASDALDPPAAAPVRAPAPRSTRMTRSLDLAEFEREFDETGSLCSESYGRLEAAGIPRRFVDAFIEGQRMRAEAFSSEIYGIVGGEERYAAMMDWARTGLSEGEQAALDAALAGSPEQMRLAIEGLNAAYSRATGDRVALIGGQSARAAGGRFETAQQVVEAMRDPRYKNDEAYRRRVQARLAQSNIF